MSSRQGGQECGFAKIITRKISYRGMNIYSKMLAFVWALSEFVRYPYYIFPNLRVLKWLRYNSFIILYPLGMFLEAVHIYLNSNN